jgi:hypothetical protein
MRAGGGGLSLLAGTCEAADRAVDVGFGDPTSKVAAGLSPPLQAANSAAASASATTRRIRMQQR